MRSTPISTTIVLGTTSTDSEKRVSPLCFNSKYLVRPSSDNCLAKYYHDQYFQLGIFGGMI